MKSQSPPRLATWLLRNLASSYCVESLEGDLFEAWRRGRGNAWYWRQVLMALVVTAWRAARIQSWSFALAVGSYWVTILLSDFGNREVVAFEAYLRREMPVVLGATPFEFGATSYVNAATKMMWFAVVFISQGYIIGWLHERYAKAAAVTALVVFILIPNAGRLAGALHHVAQSSNPTFAVLGLPVFFAENVICVLIGAGWLAKRWPPARPREFECQRTLLL